MINLLINYKRRSYQKIEAVAFFVILGELCVVSQVTKHTRIDKAHEVLILLGITL